MEEAELNFHRQLLLWAILAPWSERGSERPLAPAILKDTIYGRP